MKRLSCLLCCLLYVVTITTLPSSSSLRIAASTLVPPHIYSQYKKICDLCTRYRPSAMTFKSTALITSNRWFTPAIGKSGLKVNSKRLPRYDFDSLLMLYIDQLAAKQISRLDENTVFFLSQSLRGKGKLVRDSDVDLLSIDTPDLKRLHLHWWWMIQILTTDRPL